MTTHTELFKVVIPEAQLGNWSIQKFNVSKEESELDRIRGMFHGGRYTPPGSYTRLMRGGQLVMSDTPDEIRDHLTPYYKVKDGDNVLIAGLGLGCITQAILKGYPNAKVTVVEISPDVINLVGSNLVKQFGDRLKIIEADIFKWKPPRGAHYSVAWFDIWDDLCEDNLEPMKQLKRKFARKATWKGCWGEHFRYR